MGSRLVVTVATALAVAAAAAGGPAVADNWSGPTGASGNSENNPNTCVDNVNRTDNSGVSVYYSSNVPNELRTATDLVRQYVIDPTNVTTTTASVHLESTDVVFASQNYSSICEHLNIGQWWPDGNILAIYQCDGVPPPTLACDHAILRFHKDQMVKWHNDGLSVFVRRFVCHEFGHALSLTHFTSDDGCMQASPKFASTWYSNHDLNHINDLGNW